MTLPPLDPSEVGHHLLALPAGPTHDDVLGYARSRFPRAEPTPRATRATGPTVPVLQLSRLSTLVGPYGVDRAATNELGLPPGTATVYAVRTPTERGEAPWPDGGDRDGLARAFPGGLPVRDELRVLEWAIAVARRTGGTLRTAPGPDGRPGVLLTPETAAAVDLTVWSQMWLDPEQALAVMRQALPRAYLNMAGTPWQGPPPGVGERPILGAEVLTPEQRAAVHAVADATDIAALSEPQPLEGYGALADLELDGMIALGVDGETDLPPVVAALPWAARGAVAYRVTWEPDDLHELESERPSPTHRVARSRATPLVVAVAKAVHGAVGGEITDMMGFVVDPAAL